jgi:hypothetical protein
LRPEIIQNYINNPRFLFTIIEQFWRCLEERLPPFPETLNYTINLACQENPEMSGDEVYSPDPESAPITTYYSHSLGIQTYQNMLFLHVYIFGCVLLEKLPYAYTHVININIKHARAWREEEIRKNCQEIYFPYSRVITQNP